MAFDPLLDVALRAALAGGEAVMRVYADPFAVTQKEDKTPVTEADLASERVIVEMLTKAFPEIPVVSEETVPEAGFASPAHRFWVVDPLDGTKEFVARNGEFAVLIGLVENGRPVLGVVHGPAVGVTYVAHGPGTAMLRRNGSNGDSTVLVESTLGRFLFNEAFPDDFPFHNDAVKKRDPCGRDAAKSPRLRGDC